MNKAIIIYLLAALGFLETSAQDWNTSLHCHLNAQDGDPNYVREYRTPVREATVKILYSDGGSCTGTLINRKTDDAK